MKLLYVYAGPRDPEIEARVVETLGRRFGIVRQEAAHDGEDGMTTVTLELPDAPHGETDPLDQMRSCPGVIDAARESFGEGV